MESFAPSQFCRKCQKHVPIYASQSGPPIVLCLECGSAIKDEPPATLLPSLFLVLNERSP